MPLHRDIHWLGRQWAVTGHGLQLINQKQMGYYDIEASRLWEAGLIQSMQTKAWIDRPDFDKALDLARARFSDVAPEGETPLAALPALPPPSAPPAKSAPVEPLSEPTLEDLLAKLKTKSAPVAPTVKPAEAASAVPTKPESPKAEPAKPEPAKPEPAKPEAAKPESAKAAPPEPEPLKPSPPKPVSTPLTALAARPADPSPSGRPQPIWPVFDQKIAGRARFVRPWRARLTHWRGNLPGLPRRS